jgi:hypothetical protein
LGGVDILEIISRSEKQMPVIREFDRENEEGIIEEGKVRGVRHDWGRFFLEIS